MENPVIIFGTGGLGRAALEIFEMNGVAVYGFLSDDKEEHGKEIDAVSVLGSTDDDGFLKLIGKKTEAFVATDDNRLRKSLVKMLHERRKVQPANAVHPDAIVAKSASIGYGNFINQGVRIGAGSQIGSQCLLHSGALIDYGVKIADYVQVGAGAIIGSGVTLEEGAFIGTGATIVAGVTIGKGARVGAGSVVIGPVEGGKTVFGNPAAPITK
ncbi:acetyltransferase [Cesiribacter andamanensis]|uniref:2,3,4,5-tetrahydropyridine-2,6-dicarboxylate N-acetyltransferase n=1 Tax=Cesiribacter andamanensis AMV16 TaxID=1279009 RepID=M7N2B5_9BACT|nr:acetyltransferase [Cesiribacter andamanensis]EMR01452.1 2,3,4,5-tetrahydropyridine-2,6-dicarboxylate N-acetyltransferase [Cesiribacter andamanensis AMV16]